MWIYLECSTDSTSLVASEESRLLSMNGLNQSHIAKSIPIVKESCSVVYPTGHSLMLQFGIISRRSPMMGETGPTSISYMEDSPARISVLQDMEKDWEEKKVVWFTKYSDYPDKSAPPSFSWKMSQQLQPEVVWHWSKKLPKYGMIVDGVLYPLPALEHHTEEKDGFYLPTPKASDSKRVDSPCERRRNSPDLTATLNMKYQTKGKKIHPHFIEWMMMYPLGWTELKPWAMQWFQSKRKKPSKS